MTDEQYPTWNIKTLPCFACGKKLEDAFNDQDYNHPSHAAIFRSYGQYGSEFDLMDGTYLELNICDECINTKARQSNCVIYVPKEGHGRLYKGIII